MYLLIITTKTLAPEMLLAHIHMFWILKSNKISTHPTPLEIKIVSQGFYCAAL